jgi:hypothetical protein
MGWRSGPPNRIRAEAIPSRSHKTPLPTKNEPMTARENEDALAPWCDWDRILPRSGYSMVLSDCSAWDETGRVGLRVSAFQEAA